MISMVCAHLLEKPLNLLKSCEFVLKLDRRISLTLCTFPSCFPYLLALVLRVLAELTGRNKQRHAFMRRVLNPAFSPSFMKSLEPIVQQHLQTFVTCLTDAASKNSGQVNMNELFTHLLFAVFTLSLSSDVA